MTEMIILQLIFLLNSISQLFIEHLLYARRQGAKPSDMALVFQDL